MMTRALLVALPLVVATPALALRTSWYECCNPETASGYPFSASNKHIAAHPDLPFGTNILLAYKGRELCVTVRDRGPFVGNRELDITRAGAEHLGMKNAGVVNLSAKINGC
jgi:rare lipoprotein A